jgi:hypothetical protein
MADIEITGLTAILYAALAAVDEFAIEDIDAGETKRVALSEIKKFVLDNGTIGGTTAGDPADIDSAQTFTNKRLNGCSMNSTTAITSTSEEINKLAGCTSSTAELNKLTGVTTTPTQLNYLNTATANIQTQINALSAIVDTTTSKTYTYSLGFSQGVGETTKAITQATILAGISLSAATYVIDHASLIISLHIIQSGTYYVVPYEGAGVKYQYTTQTVNGQLQLDTITFSGLDEGKEYNVAITLKVNEKAGA